MKKLALLVVLLLAVSVTACAPTQPGAQIPSPAPAFTATPSPVSALTAMPSRAVEPSPFPTDTPQPSDKAVISLSTDMDKKYYLTETGIPDLKKVGLSDEQYYKIYELLYGVLSMSDSDKPFFQDAASLPASDLLGFVYNLMNYSTDSGTISKKTVQSIIHSAFGVDYIPKKGDCYGEVLIYRGGKFIFEASDGRLTLAYPYSITRQPSGRLRLKFNIVFDGVPDSGYMGKGEAVLQQDTDSMFGYRLISLTQGAETDFSFTYAEASSCLPAGGSRTYGAANAIDGDDGTAWATGQKSGEWIKFSFAAPQDMTGLILHFGDWSGSDGSDESGRPEPYSLEFSDDTVIADLNGDIVDLVGSPCVVFGRAITTTYVKITISGASMPYGDIPLETNVYISDVIPF